MKSVLVAAGSPGTAQEVIDVDSGGISGDDVEVVIGECRRARDVEIGQSISDEIPPSKSDQCRVVETDCCVRARLRLFLRERVRERSTVGCDVPGSRRARPGIEVLIREEVEVEIDSACDGPFDQVIAGQADDLVVTALPLIKVLSLVLPIMVSLYELPSTVSISSGSAKVKVSAPSFSVAGITAGAGLGEIDRDSGGGLGEIEAGDGASRRPDRFRRWSGCHSRAPKAKVSPPPPPTSESLPEPPSRVSGPCEPIKVSLPVPPWKDSAPPEKAEASKVESPVPAARIACWNPLMVETEGELSSLSSRRSCR